MRPEPNLRIEPLRLMGMHATPAGVSYGAFQLGGLRIISSGDCKENPVCAGWEHVSVSCRNRTPTWEEMQTVKELFWADDETVLQFHPRRDKYVNCHPFVLHMWKRGGQDHELPPRELIAPEQPQ